LFSGEFIGKPKSLNNTMWFGPRNYLIPRWSWWWNGSTTNFAALAVKCKLKTRLIAAQQQTHLTSSFS